MISDPLPGARVLQFERVGTTARCLFGNALPFGFGPVAQCQDDGADHGDEQDDAGELEQQHVLGVHDLPDGLGIGFGAGRCVKRPDMVFKAREGREDDLGEEYGAHKQSERQIAQKALLQFHKVDIQHHDNEQEQHGHGADINDDKKHGQELCPDEDKQACRREEGEDQEQD
eukprot:GHVR01011041.1.p3 GENE.GHVR01011041.1~~GHVR01011041.1.p3  ORF type:complete len:172 (+),score=30.68 GHVR01011041.1:517-1032(+)